YLKGVGPKRAEALARLGVRTMGDLLYHAPHRYLDATRVTPLAQARVGEEVTGVGRVVSTGVIPTRRGLRVFRAILRDESGLVECAWPGQPFLERTIKRGQLAGEAGPGRDTLGAEAAAHHPPQGEPAVRADGRPAARGARDLGRPDGAAPDAPVAHGRRGDRKNRRGAVRDAGGAGERLPG